MPALELTEKEYLNLNSKDLVKMFESNRNISVYFDNKRLDLYYGSGLKFNIKHTDVISISLLKKVSKSFHEKDDDDIYSTEFEIARSPLDFPKAVKEFMRLYKNTKEKKKTVIKPLTEEEIANIVKYFNEPINED